MSITHLKRPGRQFFPRSFLAGLLLLVCNSSVTAGDIENIHIEIDQIRDRLNARLNMQVEQRVQAEVRAKVRQSVEDRINDQVVESVADSVSESVRAPGRPEAQIEEIRQPDERAKTRPLEVLADLIDVDRLINTQMNRIENEIDLALNTVNDKQGNAALEGEWLIMTDADTINRLAAEGYIIKQVEELKGLGYLMGTVAAPASFDPEAIAAVQVLNDPQVIVDLNHVYLPQRDEEQTVTNRAPSADLLSTGSSWQRIGMIDSSINHHHKVFAQSKISQQPFTPKNSNASHHHGTAIASILVGQSEGYSGLAPASELYNGVVFATDDQGREYSTTAAIVRAINWLAENDVKLTNMSLAGPDNAILRQAISSACARGMVLVTAAGNAGPAAPPLFPAAYDCTIAVTAVDEQNAPYHRANRGKHIDYALPGVDIRHAIEDGSFGLSSGTSFAAAVLSGMIASEIPREFANTNDVRAHLDVLAADIGKEGRDRIYGKGLIRSTLSARISQ